MTNEHIKNIFTYHASNDHQRARYTEIRDTGRAFALLINDVCPESREKSCALTKVQEAVAWANASIAITESEPEQTRLRTDPRADTGGHGGLAGAGQTFIKREKDRGRESK